MAPPRRPPPVLWTQTELVDTVKRYFFNEDTDENPTYGAMPFWQAVRSASYDLALVAGQRNAGTVADDELGTLASISVINFMADWCGKEAEKVVVANRNGPAPIPWSHIAAATGYTDGNTAANRYDPHRRHRRATAARLRRSEASKDEVDTT